MKRLDRIISEQTNYTRKEIKKLISKKLVEVNGEIVAKSDVKLDEKTIELKIDNKKIPIANYVYILLNKPKGYTSTTDVINERSILELIPEKYKHRNLFPAGRLDKDTTGLMLITDDGIFAHNILSPRKHIKKIYEVKIDIPITKEMIDGFEKGVKLNDGVCKPSKLIIKDKYLAEVTLTEGRYHQIKRMFGCFGAKVEQLNRICMGNLFLPDDLKPGQIKEATEEELQKMQMK